jgi:hypothetical protein
LPQPRAFKRRIIVGIDRIDTEDFGALIHQTGSDVKAENPAAPATRQEYASTA